ncbi:MAG TPA: TonB-dependent receptor [Candidatus Acidoferrales bacterium]|nr:TonB-dependent receptor [Candidatus Acidoferrales bacterium]
MRWKSPFGVQTNATAARSIDSNGNDDVKDDRAIANWSSVLNAWATNNARFIYTRDFEFENPTPSLPGEPVSALGLAPQADLNSCGFGSGGATTLACSWTLGTPYYLNRQAYPDEKRYQGVDTFSISKGSHLIKFGFDITHTGDYLNAYVAGDQYGEYSYSQVTDYITDYLVAVNHLPNACVSSTSGTAAAVPCYNEYFQTVGPLAFNVPTVETGLFVQDDWRVIPRLTLNLGLRWDHESLPSPILPNPAIPQTTSFPTDNKDFGPRFGFAWDITGQGTTVVRGGYGLYFGRITNEQIYDAMTQTGNPGSQLSPTIFPTTSAGAAVAGVPVYPNVLPSYNASVGQANITYLPSDMRLPAAEEFDAVIEHEFWHNTSLSLSYIGSVGRFLPIGIDTNLNQPSTITYTVVGGPLSGQKVSEPLFTGARPKPAYNQIVQYCTCGISHYNAGVVQFKRRMTGGVQFDFSYTYASDTDDVANSTATGGSGGSATTPNLSSDGPVNPFNFRAEEGVSNLEVRNRFVGAVIWQPPYFDHSASLVNRALLSGWLISVAEIAETGLPYIQEISGNEPSGLGATISSGGPTGGKTSPRAYFVPKNSNFFPPTVNTDLRIARAFTVHERLRTELSIEAFNLFNHRNFTAVTQTAYTTGGTAAAPTLTYSSSFGNLTQANNGTIFTARQLQLGAKISF